MPANDFAAFAVDCAASALLLAVPANDFAAFAVDCAAPAALLALLAVDCAPSALPSTTVSFALVSVSFNSALVNLFSAELIRVTAAVMD